MTISALNPPAAALPAPAAAPAPSLRADIRGPARLGIALVAAFILLFGVWGGLAPIAGGAVAPGTISPESNRKTVQHLEGGIIGKLLVRDGDVVTAGQPVVMLDDVQPRAIFESLRGQYRTLLATRTRLLAEQGNLAALNWPRELLDSGNDGEVRSAMDTQLQMFETRRVTHEARKHALRQKIEQLRAQIRGMEAQANSSSMQMALLNNEIRGKEQLLEKQLVSRPDVLRLYRLQAESSGKRGEAVAAIAAARQQIGETEVQLATLDAERAEDISTQLEDNRSRLADVQERLAASRDVLHRTVITAPVSGSVMNMQFKTEGGVVRAGEPIMDIVPANDTLLIDAHVSPTDIDVVHVGLSARVRLSAFSTKKVPTIDGEVVSVSADGLTDQATRQPYYLARVQVSREQIEQLPTKVDLVPGMPAEVLIVTGERTMIEYLFEPFIYVLWRSFREV